MLQIFSLLFTIFLNPNIPMSQHPKLTIEGTFPGNLSSLALITWEEIDFHF